MTASRRNVVLSLFLFLAAASAPGAVPGIGSPNRFSKPAQGSIDELPPGIDPFDQTIPAPKRLKTIDDPGLHADQCRAVLGPIPEINCLEGDQVPVTRDGHAVTFEHGVLAEDGIPANPNILWSCDTPELLPLLTVNPIDHPAGKGSNQGCVPNVRIGHTRRGSVDWIYLCHYHSGLHEPEGDLFDFIAMIGSNRETGETCFFAHDVGKTNGVDVPTPGGRTPSATAERAKGEVFWNHPSRNTCVRCHAANKPWAVTPYLRQSRLGGDGSMDFIPLVPLAKRLTPGWGYRIIGTVHNLVMKRPKAIWPKNDDGTTDNTCTRCHVVDDMVEYTRLSRVAVGLPDLPRFDVQTHIMPRPKQPWMPLDDPDSSSLPKYQDAVRRLERAVNDPKWRAREAEVLSPCPRPADLPAKAATIANDPTAPVTLLRWTYRNDYGHVLLRDDVRFRLRIEGSDGSHAELRDIAPDALGSAEWHYRQDTKAGVTYSYWLQPYRYCFDRTAYQYAAETRIESSGPKSSTNAQEAE